MTQQELVELSPRNQSYRSIVDKFVVAVQNEETLVDVRKAIPVAIKSKESGVRTRNGIEPFRDEEAKIPRDQYLGELLLPGDQYQDGKRWKLSWKPVAGVPILQETTTFPEQLTPKSATEVRNTLWERNISVKVLDMLRITNADRDALIQTWEGRSGLNAGFAKSVVPFLALRDVVKEGNIQDVLKYFDEYYWKSSLAKTGPENKTRDPVNYRVAAVLVILSEFKTNGGQMQDDDIIEIFDKFRVFNKPDAPYRVEAYELLDSCLKANSFAPLLNENARLVGRLVLHAFFLARTKELSKHMGYSTEMYQKTIDEMIILATLKVTPTSPLFEVIQNVPLAELETIIDTVFIPPKR